VFDEIKEVSRSEEIELLSSLLESEVQIADTVVYSYNGGNHCPSPSIDIIRYLRLSETFSPWVNVLGELLGHLNQSLLGPVTKPVDYTSIEQGRRTGCSIRKVRIAGVHGEHHMQVALHILNEGFV